MKNIVLLACLVLASAASGQDESVWLRLGAGASANLKKDSGFGPALHLAGSIESRHSERGAVAFEYGIGFRRWLDKVAGTTVGLDALSARLAVGGWRGIEGKWQGGAFLFADVPLRSWLWTRVDGERVFAEKDAVKSADPQENAAGVSLRAQRSWGRVRFVGGVDVSVSAGVVPGGVWVGVSRKI